MRPEKPPIRQEYPEDTKTEAIIRRNIIEKSRRAPMMPKEMYEDIDKQKKNCQSWINGLVSQKEIEDYKKATDKEFPGVLDGTRTITGQETPRDGFKKKVRNAEKKDPIPFKVIDRNGKPTKVYERDVLKEWGEKHKLDEDEPWCPPFHEIGDNGEVYYVPKEEWDEDNGDEYWDQFNTMSWSDEDEDWEDHDPFPDDDGGGIPDDPTMKMNDDGLLDENELDEIIEDPNEYDFEDEPIYYGAKAIGLDIRKQWGEVYKLNEDYEDTDEDDVPLEWEEGGYETWNE